MSSNSKWFETWFSQSYYDLLYRHRNENEAALFINRLLEVLNPNAASTILDAACGKGRYANYLSGKGFTVTGIDLSASAILEAKQQENEHLSFFKHDMRQIFRINYFDFIFNNSCICLLIISHCVLASIIGNPTGKPGLV